MVEVELVRLHEDGERLVLAGPDGAQLTLPIDEPLRAAVRRDRAQFEHLRTQEPGTLPPREIQSRLRAGRSAQEVADDAGMPIEQVRRFEGPVLAEQEHVIAQVRKSVVGHEAGAPTLGTVVVQRLTARGVDVDDVGWSAAREGGAPWTVTARFRVGDRDRTARWTYDPSSRALHAQEDEARWLSETDVADDPIPRTPRGSVFDVDAARRAPARPAEPAQLAEPASPAPEPPDHTGTLLDDLSQRRGVRAPRAEHDDIEFEGFGPQQTFGGAQGADSDERDAGLHEPAPGPVEPQEPVGAKVLELMRPSRKDGLRNGSRGSSTPDGGTGSSGGRAGQTWVAETLPVSLTPDEPEAPDGPGATAEPRAAIEHHAAPPHLSTPDDEPSVPDERPEPRAAASAPAATTAEAGPPHEGRPDTRRARKGRAKVPSWDEIVFGAKPER